MAFINAVTRIEMANQEDREIRERRLQPGQTEYAPFGTKESTQNANIAQVVGQGGNVVGSVLTTTNGNGVVYTGIQATGIAMPTPEQRLQTMEDQLKTYASLMKVSLPSGVADLVAGLLNNLAKDVAYIKQDVLNLRNNRLQGFGNPPPGPFYPNYPNIGGVTGPIEMQGGMMETQHYEPLSFDQDFVNKLKAAAGAVVRNGS